MNSENNDIYAMEMLKQLYSQIINCVWRNNRKYYDSKGKFIKTKPNHNIHTLKKFFSQRKCNDILSLISTSLCVFQKEPEKTELSSKDMMAMCLDLLKTALYFMDGDKEPSGFPLTGALTYDAIYVYYRMSCLVTSSNSLDNFNQLLENPYVNNWHFVNFHIKLFAYKLYERFLKVLSKAETIKSEIPEIRSNLYKEFTDLVLQPYFQDTIFDNVQNSIHFIEDNYPELAKEPYNAKNELENKYYSLKDIIYNEASFYQHESHLDCWKSNEDFFHEIIHWLFVNSIYRDEKFFEQINSVCRLFIHRYTNLPKPTKKRKLKYEDNQFSTESLYPNSLIQKLIKSYTPQNNNSDEGN